MTRFKSLSKKLGLATLVVTTMCLASWGLANALRDWVQVTPAAAQTAPAWAAWTAVGASGSVDESSIPFFGFHNASAGYSLTNQSVAPLEFRYNVVNTQHIVTPGAVVPSIAMPGWRVMEFGAQAPATSTAEAYLYRVDKCTGRTSLICPIRHTNQPAPGDCNFCKFESTTFDFNKFLYYVRVVVDRNTPGEVPLAHTLRIY